jgi:hypothetical protein
VNVSSTEDDPESQSRANAALIAKLAPFVELLNALSDETARWRVAFGGKDYTDAMGDFIPAGRDHFRKGELRADGEEVRLSAASMDRFIMILFKHNRQGMELAKRAREERFVKMQQEMLGAMGGGSS